MILEGKVYKHERCMDVAFLFEKFLGEDDSHYLFVGRWVNVGLAKPAFIFNSPDNIKIIKSDVFKWKLLNL